MNFFKRFKKPKLGIDNCEHLIGVIIGVSPR